MTKEALFHIIFSGALSGEYDLQTTKRRFKKVFRLSDDQVEKLFSGKEFVIKTHVTESIAMKFAIKLSDIGCECAIQEALDPDLERLFEARIAQRRLSFDHVTSGASVEERRLLIGRRKSDISRRVQLSAS